MDNKAFSYEVEEGFDFVLEEKGNMSTNLRKVKWGNSDSAKIDIRKWYYKEGEEKCGKGISLTDEGSDELIYTLCNNGYGDTKRILESISDRADFDNALKNLGSDEQNDSSEEEEYYDPKDLLG